MGEVMLERPIDTDKRPGETEQQYVERITRLYENATAHALSQAGISSLGTALSNQGRRGGDNGNRIPGKANDVGRGGGIG